MIHVASNLIIFECVKSSDLFHYKIKTCKDPLLYHCSHLRLISAICSHVFPCVLM